MLRKNNFLNMIEEQVLTTPSVDVLVIGEERPGAAVYDLAGAGCGRAGRAKRSLYRDIRPLSRFVAFGRALCGSDPETAQECIVENEILRRIVPFAIEDTAAYL